jgi:hypothetical protein
MKITQYIILSFIPYTVIKTKFMVVSTELLQDRLYQYLLYTYFHH